MIKGLQLSSQATGMELWVTKKCKNYASVLASHLPIFECRLNCNAIILVLKVDRSRNEMA